MTRTGCPLCTEPRRREIVAAAEWQLVRCLACGLYYRDPRPAERLRRHYDNIYEDDASSDYIDERRRAVFAAFLERFEPRGGCRLLDIGCGSGEFLTRARERGWKVEGVEVSPRGAAMARRRGLTVHDAVDDLPDGTYAVVTLWNVIDFFSRPLEAMQQMRRVLSPGGAVLVRAPNAVFQLAAWRMSRMVVWPAPLARFVRDAYFFQPLVWSPQTLRGLLEGAGFTRVRLWNSEPSWGDPYHPSSLARELTVSAVKRGLRALAQAVEVASSRRLLIGSSISAEAYKPD